MSTATPEYIIKAPELRGGALQLGTCRDTEVGLDGPAGTGKTFSILYYIHVLMLRYPGAKWLVTRRYGSDLAGSATATYQNDVLDPNERVTYFGGNRVKPAGFVYPNGSFIAINGLDRPGRLKSFECDGVYINEATECEIDHLEYARMRLRKGIIPWQQIIMDFNPDAPTHWLNERMNSGLTTRLLSRHEDNPRYYDAVTQDWTEEGRRYIFGILGGLTGVRYARYRLGLWAAAEGTVYQDAWDRSRNIIDRYTIPRAWPRYLAIDFGYTNPFCCLWCAVDPDGRLIIYRQLYKTKALIEEHARQIAISSGWFHLLPSDHPKYQKRPAEWADPLPRDIICDHDAQGRAVLEAHLKLYTTPAKKTILDGIQAVTSRLRPAGDGIPRLQVMRDSLVERDQELVKMKLPTCLEEEAEVYVWDMRQGRKTGEEPVDANNHACLVAGTAIATDHGDVPIEQIQVGDYVLTRNGYRPVKGAGMTARRAEVLTVTLSNGMSLTGTGNHPVYLNEQGYIALRAVRYGDIIEDISLYKERYPLVCQSLQQKAKLSCTKGLRLDAIPIQRTGQTGITTGPISTVSRQGSKHFMLKSGKMLMDLCQRGVRSIIRMGIHQITHCRTWNALPLRRMQAIMQRIFHRSDWNKPANDSMRYVLWRRRGTNQKKGAHGTAPLGRERGNMQNTMFSFVSTVEKSIGPENSWMIIAAFALTIVRLRGDANQGLITEYDIASSADGSLNATNMQRRTSVLRHAPSSIVTLTQDKKHSNVQFARNLLRQTTHRIECVAQKDARTPYVVSIEKNSDKQVVYNLTVENPVGEGEYFANGVLVHNCDTARYLVAYHDLTIHSVSYFKNIWQ